MKISFLTGLSFHVCKLLVNSLTKNAAKEFVIPENSVAAVAEAKRRGYEGIELDVRKTKDGVMVVFHDKALTHTQNEQF